MCEVDDGLPGQVGEVDKLVARDPFWRQHHAGLAPLHIDVEARLYARRIEDVGGDGHPVRILVRVGVVDQHRHADLAVGDAPVGALLEGAEAEDRGPDRPHRIEDGAARVAERARGRGVEAGAGEAVEVFGVGARAELHPLVGEIGGELLDEQRGEGVIDRRGEHVVLQVDEGSLARGRVAGEGGVVEHGIEALVEAVLLHELEEVVDGDDEALRVGNRHAGDLGQAAEVAGLAAEGGDCGIDGGLQSEAHVEHLFEVAEVGDAPVGARDTDSGRAVRLPPGVGLGLGDFDEPVVGSADLQLHPLAVEGTDGLVGEGAREPHVGRAPVLCQHIDVRQRGLELGGDDAAADLDVVGDGLQHDDVAEGEILCRQLVLRHEPELAEGAGQVERLVGDALKELVAVDDGDIGGQAQRLARDGVGGGVEAELAALPVVVADDAEGIGDHLGTRRVVGCDLVGPDARPFVVVERAEEEAAVRGVVLGLVELAELRDERQAVAREVGRGELPVDGVTAAVLDVEAVAVHAIDDGFRRASAGDALHERRCSHSPVVVEAADAGC